MFLVHFFKFQKDVMSTKIPEQRTALTSINCMPRTDTSMQRPVLIVKLADDEVSKIYEWNYAKVDFYNRYYFVEDWTYYKGYWEVSLRVDVLASFRQDIFLSKAYILRAYNNDNVSSRGELIDTFLPTGVDAIQKVAKFTATGLPFRTEPKSMTAVVGIVNNDNNALGAVSYYAFEWSQLRALNNKLFINPDWMNIPSTELSAELVKGLVNPFQYISSAKLFPFSLPSLPYKDFLGNLSFAWWDFSLKHWTLTDYTKEYPFTIQIPKHPNWKKYDYLQAAPYSTYSLYFPSFGDTPIPSEWLIGKDSIDGKIRVDYVTGVAMITLSDSLGNAFPLHLYGKVGVDLQLGQVSSNVLGAASAAIGAASDTISSISRLDLGGAIGNAASGIVDAIQTATPMLSTKGSNGTLVEIGNEPQLTAMFRMPYGATDETYQKIGKPIATATQLFRVKNNSNSSFVKVLEGHVETWGTADEISEINDALTKGVFLE